MSEDYCSECGHKHMEGISIHPTGFEDKTLEQVLAEYLYTSQNMFGEVVYDAQRELFKRTPPPEWAKKHPLPTMAKEFHENLHT